MSNNDRLILFVDLIEVAKVKKQIITHFVI